jgi:hypothetical protein|tara:strand:- start:344 stop:508 length:165 start_codon:yes stop_codon:yes gene_type:complete
MFIFTNSATKTTPEIAYELFELYCNNTLNFPEFDDDDNDDTSSSTEFYDDTTSS